MVRIRYFEGKLLSHAGQPPGVCTVTGTPLESSSIASRIPFERSWRRFDSFSISAGVASDRQNALCILSNLAAALLGSFGWAGGVEGAGGVAGWFATSFILRAFRISDRRSRIAFSRTLSVPRAVSSSPSICFTSRFSSFSSCHRSNFRSSLSEAESWGGSPLFPFFSSSRSSCSSCSRDPSVTRPLPVR